jgi:hypothetical protein
LTAQYGEVLCSGRTADDTCNEACRGSKLKERILDTLPTKEALPEILCFTQYNEKKQSPTTTWKLNVEVFEYV